MLDVRKSPELAAAVLAMAAARRDVTSDINKDARRTLGPEWLRAVQARSGSGAAGRTLAKGAKVGISTRQVTLKAATSNKALRGGLVPSSQWQGYEFGMTPKRDTHTRTSTKGKKYNVTATVGRQFPARAKNGRHVFQAASEVGHSLVVSWLGVIVNGFKTKAIDVEGGR